jgi:hypothetical protein
MMKTVTIWNRQDDCLVEIDTPVSENGEKRVITLPLDSPVITEANFSFGNLIKIGDWFGMILSPRTWTEEQLEVTAYPREAVEEAGYAKKMPPFREAMKGKALWERKDKS